MFKGRSFTPDVDYLGRSQGLGTLDRRGESHTFRPTRVSEAEVTGRAHSDRRRKSSQGCLSLKSAIPQPPIPTPSLPRA